MEGKKITFGFAKTIKKSQLQPIKTDIIKKNKIELITCLEGKEIKLVEKKAIENPLVIPLQNSSKTSRALESLKLRKAVLEGNDVDTQINVDKEKTKVQDINISKLDSLEKRAITELLLEASKEPNDNLAESSLRLTLVVNPEDLPLDGAKESTLDDYDNIPINQFGMAMLRGMGLNEESIKKKSFEDLLCPRPKGMGLGADKAIKRFPMLVEPEEREKLEIKKNACVKILAGKYKSKYGIIEGLDDRTGRVIVKLAIGGLKETLGEYLVQPVSQKEYQIYGKVINSDKYAEYAEKTNIKEKNFIKDERNIKVEKEDKSYNRNDFHKYISKNNSNMQNKDSIPKNYQSDEEFTSKLKRYNENMNNKSNNYSKNPKYPENFAHENNYSRQCTRSGNFTTNRSDSDSCSSANSLENPKLHKKSKHKYKLKKSKKHKHKSTSSTEEEDNKKHKKKTKKSRKSRSRSRHRK